MSWVVDHIDLPKNSVSWGSRVVVPPPGRNQALSELHGGHPDVQRWRLWLKCFVGNGCQVSNGYQDWYSSTAVSIHHTWPTLTSNSNMASVPESLLLASPAAHIAVPGIIRSLSLSMYESVLMNWENILNLQSEVPTHIGQESPLDVWEVAVHSSHHAV